MGVKEGEIFFLFFFVFYVLSTAPIGFLDGT